MSKYIKLYDAIMAMDEWFCEPITPTKILSDLPTIEVSEDCISREWVYNELTKVTAVTPTQIDMLSDFADIIKDAPSVVPSCQKNRQVERAEGEWVGMCNFWSPNERKEE